MIHLYISWIIFAMAVGAMEARVHHWRGSDIGNDKWIHSFYWSVRAVVWGALASCIWLYPVQNAMEDSKAIVIFAGVCMAVFPFFHSGTQFTARRIMSDRLNYHWFSKSTGTNAVVNAGPIFRTVFFVASLYVMIRIWG